MQNSEKKQSTDLLANFGLSEASINLESGDFLELIDVVRHVPQRRCVCRALWQGKRVYVKLFFGAKAEHYAMRDVNGIRHFQEANILTPEILLTGPLKQVAGFAVVLEEIVAVNNAETLLHESAQKQLKIGKKLMQTLAAHHQAGLVQTDMYLKNFLVGGEKVYSIDGDGVRSYGVITQGKAITNLSQLLSKFDVLMIEMYLDVLLEAYSQARSWVVFPNLDDVKTSIDAARLKAANAYADKKVFRQCTDVNVARNNTAFTAIRSDCSAITSKVIEEIDRYFTPETVIKDGNTCTVARAILSGQDVVIKRYNIKSFWHGVNRALRKTRAAISWGNAHRLQLLGLPTAPPIALVETQRVGLKGKAYFLAEYIDAPDMVDFFQQTSDKGLRANVIKQMAQLFYRLYLLKISHGDMKANNIKVLIDGRPLLLDLDSMQQHKSAITAQKAHARDLKRFMRNWKDQPSLYNAFVKVFKVVYADHTPLQAAKILE